MNSRQRRKQRRRYGHVATVAVPTDKTGWLQRITDMDRWCHGRYGKRRYLYSWRSWDDGAAFCFETESEMVEFMMRWA